jgi:outer membrane lipoprotein-sorting protein
MKRILSLSILLTLSLGFISSSIFSQDAATLLKSMDNVIFASKDKQGNVTMILTNKNGKEKVREAVMMQKGTEKRVYRYTAPESQAGIATLSLPDGIMWMYMPALGKPKKISLMAKTGAFNNTDFSYEDMATTPYSERYIPELLENSPENYVIALTPMDDNSQYSKVVVALDKTNFYPIRMEYFDKRGDKFKEAVYQYEKIGKYWNAKEVVMTDLKKGHSTKILLEDVKFDQGLSDDLFTVESLAPEEK